MSSTFHTALAAFGAAVAGLVEAADERDAEVFEPGAFITAWQQLESLRNRLSVIDHALIGQVEAIGLAEWQAYPRFGRS